MCICRTLRRSDPQAEKCRDAAIKLNHPKAHSDVGVLLEKRKANTAAEMCYRAAIEAETRRTRARD